MKMRMDCLMMGKKNRKSFRHFLRMLNFLRRILSKMGQSIWRSLLVQSGQKIEAFISVFHATPKVLFMITCYAPMADLLKAAAFQTDFNNYSKMLSYSRPQRFFHPDLQWRIAILVCRLNSKERIKFNQNFSLKSFFIGLSPRGFAFFQG